MRKSVCWFCLGLVGLFDVCLWFLCYPSLATDRPQSGCFITYFSQVAIACSRFHLHEVWFLRDFDGCNLIRPDTSWCFFFFIYYVLLLVFGGLSAALFFCGEMKEPIKRGRKSSRFPRERSKLFIWFGEKWLVNGKLPPKAEKFHQKQLKVCRQCAKGRRSAHQKRAMKQGKKFASRRILLFLSFASFYRSKHN